MAQLKMHNGEVRDKADEPERCPECGRPLLYVENRGDATAYVHSLHGPRRECLV